MQKTNLNGLLVWQFEHFSKYKNLRHFITDRNGGCSKGVYSSLNVSFKSGDNIERADRNREIISGKIGIPKQQLVFPDQVHSANVKIVEKESDFSNLKDTDAIITQLPNVCLAVTCADCVPVLLFDTKKKVIAAIHSGWRGTVSKIVGATIKKMKEFFQCNSVDIIAGIGPSISQRNYEVSNDVIVQFEQAFENSGSFIERTDRHHGLLDLWQANTNILLEEGVKNENIELAGICTFANEDFFSARRQGVQCGRFASGIILM